MYATYTVFLREVKRFFRTKSRFLGGIATPFFWMAIVGVGMKSAVSLRGQDVNYFNFMVPGIIAMTLLFSSMFSGISVIFDREFGFLKEMLVAPVSRTSIVIGKILGSTSLGYYSLAYNWGYLVRGYISGAVARVAFPEISANQKNNIKVEQILTMLFDKVSFFVFPITMGLFVVAPEFISGIYGDQWSQSTPILRILLISGIIGAFGSIGSMLLKAIGKPEIELKVSIVSLIVFVMCIVPATR